MSRRRNRSRNKKESKERIVFHQQNPPPGELAACGKIVDLKILADILTIDRDKVDCPDCLSRPNPTIVIR